MVATIVLVVSNKPIQSSMNNTSSDSKVTMRVDETSMADESMAHGAGAMRTCMAPWHMHLRRRNIEISEKKKHVEDLGHDVRTDIYK